MRIEWDKGCWLLDDEADHDYWRATLGDHKLTVLGYGGTDIYVWFVNVNGGKPPLRSGNARTLTEAKRACTAAYRDLSAS